MRTKNRAYALYKLSGQGVKKMLRLFTNEEIKRLERKIENDPAIKEAVSNKYDDYKICIEELEKIFPILKEFACRPEFEI